MKTKTILTTIFTAMLLVPFATPASEGTAGGGGGDPRDIRNQTKSKRSAFSQKAQSEYVELGTRIESEQKIYDLKKLKEALVEDANQIKIYHFLFSSIAYPFSATFSAQVDISKAADAILNSTISIGENLKIRGKRVTFISESESNTLVVDLKRYQENSDLPPYTRLATVFHEGLRLQGIEASREYKFSNEFALAVRDSVATSGETYTNFWRQVDFSDFFMGCKGRASDYQRFLRLYGSKQPSCPTGSIPSVYGSLPFTSELDGVGCAAQRCLANPNSLNQTRGSLVAQPALFSSSSAELDSCGMELSRLITQYLKLGDEASKVSSQLAAATDPAKHVDLSTKLAVLRSQQRQAYDSYQKKDANSCK